jgi:hypothetical protein
LRAPLPDSVEVRFWRFVATAAKMDCVSFQDTIVIGREMSRSACAGGMGDTTVYLYRDGAGKFMAAGRFVWSDSSHIDHASGALEATLVKEFGRPITCIGDDWSVGPQVTHYWMWNKGGYVVQWRSTAGSQLVFAGMGVTQYYEVQLVRQTAIKRKCLQWVNPPSRD